MYTNLNLYYLNQMGITPWISKNIHEVYVNPTNKNISLLVVTPKLNVKEQYLLHNIFLFLGLPKNKYFHLEMNDIKKLNELESVFTLWFGLNPEYPTPSKIKVESLSVLLSNPGVKRKLFHDLTLLKEQLALL